MTAGVEIMCDVENCPAAQAHVVLHRNVVLVRLCERCWGNILRGGTRILKNGLRITGRYIGPEESISCDVYGCGEDSVQYIEIGRRGARPLKVHLCVGHDTPDTQLKLFDGTKLEFITT